MLTTTKSSTIKTKAKGLKAIAAATLLVATGSAMADTYVGFGVGQVNHDIENFDEDTGLSVYLGNRVSEGLALEVFYTDFGTAEDEIIDDVELSANTFGAGSLVGGQPSEGVNLFVNVGVHAWDAEIESDVLNVREDEDGSDIYYGFGASVELNPAVSVGARYTNYDLDGDDVSLVSVNMEAHF